MKDGMNTRVRSHSTFREYSACPGHHLGAGRGMAAVQIQGQRVRPYGLGSYILESFCFILFHFGPSPSSARHAGDNLGKIQRKAEANGREAACCADTTHT